jgi:phage-related protein
MALRVVMMTNPIGLILTLIAMAAYLIISNWGAVKRFLMGVWNWIKGAFHDVAQIVMSLARKGFLGPVGWIITHWTQLKDFFSGLVDSIKRIAGKIASALWDGIKTGASSVVGFVKGIVNGIIAGLEWLVNKGIDGINNLIDLANNVPGVHIGKIGHVSIPRMATGGIVNGARLSMIGEDGPEAVIPLSSKYRARGAALYAQAGAAMGMGGHTFIVNNAQNLDENQLAARFAWQMQTRMA